MLISRNLMLSVIAFVVIVFVCVLIYLFARSYMTSKRVREAERAHELLFLARVQAHRREKEQEQSGKVTGSIVYVPDNRLSDFAQRPYSLRHEAPSDPVTTDIADEVPQIPENPGPTRKLSEFFD